MVLTYALLALSVLTLWLGSGPGRSIWLLVFAASLVSALFAGVVQPLGLLWVMALAWATWSCSASGAKPWRRALAGALVVLLAGGLMLHRLPGFHNVRVIDAVRFTPDAVPFTLYLNYDKTLLGLFILGWGHTRLGRVQDWREMLRVMLPWAAGLMAVVLLLSVAAGYVRIAPKFPAESLLWLGVNLGFTCLAEEAFFRGFVQERLQRVWSGLPAGPWLALVCAAILFGLAHYAGGPAYVALATVAGAGYGWIYRRTGRIEASILTHFGLNTLHFFLFTYPALAAS